MELVDTAFLEDVTSDSVRVQVSPGALTYKFRNYEIGILEIETEEGKLVISLEKKDLAAIKTLIMDREKEIMNKNPMNPKERVSKDKILKRLDKLQWWKW